MGLGSQPLLCRRTSLCNCNYGFNNHVQEPWLIELRYHFLHRMALSALGHQTILEPFCRQYSYQTVLGCNYTTTDGGFNCIGWTNSSSREFCTLEPNLLLANRFQLCHTRYCGRWFLYAGTRHSQPVLLCWNQKYFLPNCFYFSSRRIGVPIWISYQ